MFFRTPNNCWCDSISFFIQHELNQVSCKDTVKLAPAAGVHSFHLHTDQRQAIQQVLKAYGLQATVDDSVRSTQLRLDADDATFEQAMRTLGMLTHTFYVPVDAHRVVVAHDTPEMRQQFVRQELETVYLPGLTATELKDVGQPGQERVRCAAAQVWSRPREH